MRWKLYAAVSLIAMPIAAFGQTPAPAPQDAANDEAGQLSDIIVTANKRDERLIDVPQTINVVTGEDFAKFNATRFDDVVRFVPGLDISDSGGRTAAISMRGVAFNPDAQTNSTVDIYLNEIPFDPTQAIQAQFDLGAIQVLRGPQGTLRGGTGPSGAILIGTREPDLNDIHVNGSVSYSDLNNLNLQGGASVPLIKDVLAVRIAGLYDWNSGAGVHNIVNGREDFNRSYAGRVSVLFQPTPDLRILAMHQRFRGKNERLTAVQSVAGQTGRFGLLSAADRTSVTLGGNQQITDGSATILNATWDFAGHRLTYLGSYQDNQSNSELDLNLGNVRTPAFLNFVIPGAGNRTYQHYQNIRIGSERLTNELRFERTGDHFWIYRFGVFMENSKTQLAGLIDYTGAAGSCNVTPGVLSLLGLPCITLGGGTPPRVHNRGYFTTQTFHFTDSDTLELGLRYSTSRTITGTPDDQSFKAWTGSASYRHEFGEAAMVYASYGRSYRPGGYDTSSRDSALGANQVPLSLYRWGPERSDSAEIGMKGELFGRRLSYALSTFYQKFDGFINRANDIACTGNPNGVGPLPGTVYNTSNGLAPSGSNLCRNTGSILLTYQGAASARGVELDLRGRIVRGWTGQLTLTYADAHYDNALIPCNDYNGDGVPNQNGTPAVQAGRYYSLCKSNGQLSAIPKLQISFNTDYNFDIGDGFNAYLRGLARYGDRAVNANTGTVRPETFKVDAYAGVQAPNGIEFGLFLRNVFDQRKDVVDTVNFRDLFGTTSGYNRVLTYDQRREFGVTVRANF